MKAFVFGENLICGNNDSDYSKFCLTTKLSETFVMSGNLFRTDDRPLSMIMLILANEKCKRIYYW